MLTWLLEGEQTIPPDRGLFLERTFRLHPDVCRYISDEFYEGRLRPDPSTAERTTPLGHGPALPAGRARRATGRSRRRRSRRCAALVAELHGRRHRARRGAGRRAVQRAGERARRARCPTGARVGTVDKFQGQEAAVVVYSMASSSGEDVPRGLEFLLSRNRLNVAISRARCLAYLVASPGCSRSNAARSSRCGSRTRSAGSSSSPTRGSPARAARVACGRLVTELAQSATRPLLPSRHEISRASDSTSDLRTRGRALRADGRALPRNARRGVRPARATPHRARTPGSATARLPARPTPRIVPAWEGPARLRGRRAPRSGAAMEGGWSPRRIVLRQPMRAPAMGYRRRAGSLVPAFSSSRRRARRPPAGRGGTRRGAP